MNLQHRLAQGQVLIRDLNSNYRNDLMCVVPLTGDTQYDEEVLTPFIESVCNIPNYLRAMEAAERLLTVLAQTDAEAAAAHRDQAITELRALLAAKRTVIHLGH